MNVSLLGNLRPEEIEAIWLVWEKRGHTRDEEIPDEDAKSILAEIQERQRIIERSALDGLKRATSEGRRYPRRHQRFALMLALPAFLMLLLVIWLLSR